MIACVERHEEGAKLFAQSKKKAKGESKSEILRLAGGKALQAKWLLQCLRGLASAQRLNHLKNSLGWGASQDSVRLSIKIDWYSDV